MEGLTFYEDGQGNPIPLPLDQWEQVPVPAQALILLLLEQNRRLAEENRLLRARVQELEERLGLNSKNSSRPPSSDPPGTVKKKKPATGRSRGGQKGHRGTRREFLPEREVTRFTDHYPDSCGRCGQGLSVPPEPTQPPLRQQVFDLPPLRVEVEEHRFHKICCPHCLHTTLAARPAGVPWGMLGPELLALTSVLTGRYRMSRRDVQDFLSSVLGIGVSLGAVKDQEELVSLALAPAVQEVAQALQASPVVNCDETGWKEKDRRAWLWCVNAPDMAIYRIDGSRSREAAKAIIGPDFGGILGTDRYSAYSDHPVEKRQICWSHLGRDFERIAGRSGASMVIGEGGLEVYHEVFKSWHAYQAGELSRAQLVEQLSPVQDDLQSILEQGVRCGHSKTEKTCQNLLNVFPAFWTFAREEGVEPTNNSSERALRPGVRWRRVSFGSQSEEGSRFVERMLTTVETCRRQGRNALAFVTEAIRALIDCEPSPSMLPRPGG